MKARILWIAAIVMLVSTYAVSAGDFRILDTSLAELFEVTTAGVVSVQTSLFAPTIVVNGTLFNATTATVDFAADSIPEGDVAFATSCGAGNHLYISGNDLACEADSDIDTNESTRFDLLAATDCTAGELVIGINDTGGVLCAADSGGLDNVVEDTTPQLGGNLDLNTFDIYNAAGGITNMTIDGSGNFIITLGS